MCLRVLSLSTGQAPSEGLHQCRGGHLAQQRGHLGGWGKVLTQPLASSEWQQLHPTLPPGSPGPR